MSINDAITKAIQDNLPAATALELQKYIQEAESAKDELRRSLDSVSLKDKHIRLLDTEILDHKANLERAGDLSKREAALLTAESKLAITIAELKALEAEKRAEGIKDLHDYPLGISWLTQGCRSLKKYACKILLNLYIKNIVGGLALLPPFSRHYAQYRGSL